MGHNDIVLLEKDFQKKVLKKLREIPHSWWVKLNDRVTSGLPDIVGCVAGVFIAIELKTKSKVTALQAYTLRKIDSANGQTFVATPDNWAEIYQYLIKLSGLSPKKPTE
jgi:sulfur transfer protein SufE